MRQGVSLEQRACSVMIAALSVDMDAVTRFLMTMQVTGNLVMDDNDDDLASGGDGSSPMATSPKSAEAPEATTTTQQPMKFNVHIYTSLISGMARKGNQANARRLWEEMRKNGVRPTTATYTAMVEAYGRAGNIKAAMSLLKKYTYANKGQLNKVMATSVLVNAIRHNHMSQAQELLSTWANKMGISVDKKMDPEFWSAVIWVKVLEDIELARDFYGSLYDHNPDYVDAVMVNHLVNGSSEVGRPEKVLDTFALHQYIPSSSPPSWEKRKTVHRPDPISPHYFLVDSLFRCRDVPAALSAMVVMRKHAVPDDITMAMVIRGLVMNGENDLAWRLFLKLKSRGLEPTIQAYTSIIKACIHGAHRGAKKQPATQEGEQQSIPPSLVESSLGITSSTAASGLISNKKIGPDQAYLLFRKMTGFQKPNAYTYTTLISCFAKHNIGRAVAIFTHMCNDGVEPVMETYVSLLQGCAIFRNAPLALMVFKHMQEQKKANLAPNNQVLHYLLKSLVRARMDKKDIDRFGDLVRANNQQ
jgi:pentatricopeptide repeat protein